MATASVVDLVAFSNTFFDLTDNDYRVTYVIDYDMISDSDLATLNLSRDIDTLRNNYVEEDEDNEEEI